MFNEGRRPSRRTLGISVAAGILAVAAIAPAHSQDSDPSFQSGPLESPSVFDQSAFNLDDYYFRLGITAPKSIFVCEMNSQPSIIQDENDLTPDLVRVEDADCEEFTPFGEVVVFENLTADIEFLGVPELTDLNEVRAAGIAYPPVFDSVPDGTVFYDYQQ